MGERLPDGLSPVHRAVALFVLAAPMVLAGCVDTAPSVDLPSVQTLDGWAPTDVRAIDPSTYDQGPQRPEREPTIAINPMDPSNVILVTTEEVQAPRYESWLRFFYSHDGGLNWTESRVLDEPERPGAVGDPSLSFGADGVAYFAYLSANGLGIDRSTDGGHTWQRVGETGLRGPDPATDRCSSPDKQLITNDHATDVLYMAWTRFSHDCSSDDLPGHRTVNQILFGNLRMEVVLARSTDGGRTWSEPEPVYDRSAIGAVPLVGPDGQIHVVMWGSLETTVENTYCASDYGAVVSSGRDNHAAIIVRSSLDGRAPWRTHIQPICDLNIGPAALATTGATTWAGYGFIAPAATLDAARNALHVAYVTTEPGSTTSRVWEIHSDPGVTSWSKPVAVGGSAERDAFLPAIATDQSLIHLQFNELTAERRYAAFYRASKDGGETWSAAIRLSTDDYELTGDNIGDYNWIDASGGRVAATWTGTAGPEKMQVWSRSGFFGATK